MVAVPTRKYVAAKALGKALLEDRDFKILP